MNKANLPTNLINYTSIITAVSFLIVILITVLILWPKFQELKIVQKNIEGKKAEIQVREAYSLKLSEIKAKLEEYQPEFSKINSALPTNPSHLSLLNELQKTSAGSGLILAEISPAAFSPSTDLPGLRESVFSIKVVGSYSSFKNFLSTLEKSARLIEIGGISFSSGEGKGSFSFDVKLKTLSY